MITTGPTMSKLDSHHRAFRAYAWIVLGYTMIVIMWGAYVRATGSGAGCGDHWPLCNGEVIPLEPTVARMIEFSHRLSSGLSLLLVAALFFWARRLAPVGSHLRRAAGWSLIFILGEAAVGAVLVILKLVAGNDSMLRAVVIAAHLVNTFLLLFWLARVVFWSASQQVPSAAMSKVRMNLAICLGLFVLTGAAGAIVALGDTLFPTETLAQGIAQDFSPAAHFLIKLRIWHPLFAVCASAYIVLQCVLLPRIFKGQISGGLAFLVAGLIVLQLVGGVVNWYLLAPVGMQLFHLLLADVTWVALCFWYFSAGHKKESNI